MQIQITPATADQEPILANLIELYAHDFSELADLELHADGRFGYAPLPLYWQEPARYPFLVLVDGRLAGFALVKQGSELSDAAHVWDMAEFFIVRKYRRLGVGMQVAHEVWRKFPGRWEVRVMNKNQAGQAFWQRAVAAFMGFAVAASVHNSASSVWHVFTFDTEFTKSN